MCLSKLTGKISALMLAVMLIASTQVYVSAESAYKGSGTANDPYLVETAAQLNDIRSNLSACYKLAATIDLSGYSEFKPIGYIAKPFKGSFVCDLGSDGLPKYTVINLKVAVKDTLTADPDWIKNWTPGINKMEAALFGASDGATFTNIYVLNVDVSNDNFGDNSGGVSWGNFKPGQDEKNAAALVGDAKKTTITGCASTGKIDAKPNHVGGLIGFATNCTITKCYSKVNIKNVGLWNIGGLIGTSVNSKISQCFATGDIDSAAFGSGGFIGDAEQGSISNCYSTGNIINSGANFSGSIRGGVTFTNCFAIGKGGSTKWENVSGSYNNALVLNTYASTQPQFKAATKAEILTAFSTIAGWNTTGVDYPELKSLTVMKNVDEYVAGNTSSQTTSGNSTSETTIEETQEGTDASDEDTTIQKLVASLTALPNDSELVTLDNKAAIKEAKKLYDSLNDTQLDLLDQNSTKKINLLYKAISTLLVKDIVDRIDKLPEVKKLKAADKQTVMAIKDDFDFIPKDNQDAIDTSYRDRLEASVKAVEKFSDNVSEQVVQTALSVTDWILIGILSFLILVVLAATGLMTAVVIKAHLKTTKGGL